MSYASSPGCFVWLVLKSYFTLLHPPCEIPREHPHNTVGKKKQMDCCVHSSGGLRYHLGEICCLTLACKGLALSKFNACQHLKLSKT